MQCGGVGDGHGMGAQAGKMNWSQIMVHFECHARNSGHLQGLVCWGLDNRDFRGRQRGGGKAVWLFRMLHLSVVRQPSLSFGGEGC